MNVINLKKNIFSILAWSFFSFSVLMLTELFPLGRGLMVIFFNIMALGYIFYFGIKYGYPSANMFGLSMLTFHLLILLFFYLYAKIVLLNERPQLYYRAILYLVSNALVAPTAYWLLLTDVKKLINKFK